MAVKRSAVPESVRRAVLIEAGYRCGVPTCRSLLILDLHHLDPVRKGGGNSAGNLLALCPTCHALYERGKLPGDAVRAWKAVLVSLSSAFDRTAIDELLLLEDLLKQGRESPAVTGDGIGRYSSLVFSGLAEYQGVGGLRGGLHGDWFNVRITDRGLALLEAWRSGDAAAVGEAVRTPRAAP